MFTITYTNDLCKLGDDPKHYWVMEAARARGCTNSQIGAYSYFAFDGQGISTLYVSPLALYNGAVTWLVTNYPGEFELE